MATLSGNKIKDTYQSLIKLTDNGNLTTGAKQLTDGFGNNSPLYISTTQIGIGVTPEATYDLHVYSNAKVGGNLTVTGDLTVEGTTTTIDTQTLTVEDPLIEVASNNTSTDAVDIGWYGKYAPSGTVLYAGLFRDTGDSKFKLFRNLEEQPTTTVNTSGTGYTVATLVADVEGTLTGVIASTTTATTQSTGDNSTKVATTAYVDASIGNSTLAEVLVNGDTTGGGNIVFGDSGSFLADDTLMFGASNDLVIYHDGSNSFIREKGTGNLYIDSDVSINFRSYTGAENMLVANKDGSVDLYYDASKKLETTTTGVTVTGTVSATTFSGQLDGTISSTTTATTQTQGDNSTKVATTAYVDSAIGGQDTLAEILANGNTTGGTDIVITAGDKITNFTSTGIDDNATSTALTINSSEDATFTGGINTSGNFINIGNGQNNAENYLQLGNSRTGNGFAYIDFVGDTTYTDFGLRIIRGSTGANATSTIEHRGTGNLDIKTTEAANLRLQTANTTAITIDSSQNATFAGNLTISGTGQSSFAGQVTVPATPSASTDAASKGYVDSQVGANNELSEVLANGNTTGGTDISVSAGDNITFTDTSVAYFGSGNDLSIEHSGTLGQITNSTGHLYIQNGADNSDIIFRSDNGSGGLSNYILADGSTGAVNLYHYGSKKFETTSTGVSITGGASLTDNIDINGNNKHIRFIDTYGNWLIEAGDGANNFKIHSQSLAADYLTLEGGGQLNLGEYGSGSFTGTATYRLAVDSSGDVIEIPIGGGAVDGSGTANYVTKWSDTDTITNSIIYDNGTNIGIGTTSPTTAKLVVDADQNTYGLRIDGDTTTGQSYGVRLRAGTNSVDAALRVENTSASTMFLVRGDGQVGIGTDSPSGELHVKSSSGNSDLILERNGYTAWDISAGSTYLSFQQLSGSELMRIDSSGNVGIGTTSLGTEAKLAIGHISTSEGGQIVLHKGTSGTYAPHLDAYTSGGSDYLRILKGTNTASSAAPFVFDLTRDRLGIGTTSPSQKLHVSGNGLIFGNLFLDGSANSFRAIAMNTSDGFDNQSIYLCGGGTASAARGALVGALGNEFSARGGELVLQGGRVSTGHIVFSTGTTTTERMRIDSSGNVGINVTSPNAGLQIALGGTAIPSAGSNTGSVCFGNTTSGSAYGLVMGANSSGVGYISSQRTDGTATTYNLAIQPNGGNTGIGTSSPNDALEVAGNNSTQHRIRINNAGTGTSTLAFMQGTTFKSWVEHNNATGNFDVWQYTNNPMRFATNNTERMRINSSGFVSFSQGDGTIGGAASITHHTNNYLYIRGGSAGIVVGDDGSDSRMLVANNNFINFETQNTERMRIDSSGNVGINRTSIAQPSSGATTLAIQGTSTTKGGAIRLYSSDDSVAAYIYPDNTNGLSINTSTSHPMVFRTAGTERMRIDSSGDVGIGTTPETAGATWRTLFVGSSLALVSRQSVTGSDALLANNYYINSSNVDKKRVTGTSSRIYLDGDVFRFQNSASAAADSTVTWSEPMRIAANGNTGIGTTLPDYKLDIRSGELAVRSGSSGNGGLAKLGNSSSNAILQLYDSSGNEDVRISTSLSSYFNGGNVGIGTTSPTNLLDIKSNGSSKGLDIHHSNGNIVAQLIHGGSGDEGQLKLYDSNVETVRIAGETNVDSYINSGNVGIGTTSPSAKLDIAQGSASPVALEINTENTFCDVLMNSFYSTSATRLRVGTNDFQIHTNGSQNLTVTSSGNVGIGTSSPSANLHISGSGDRSIAITSGTSGASTLNLGDSADIDAGAIIYDNSDNSMQFKTNAGLRMRINSSGNITMYNNLVVDGDLTAGFLGDPYLFYTSISSQTVVIDSGKLAIGVASSSGSRMHVKAPTGTSTICVIQTGDNANNNVKAIEFRDSTFTDCGEITVNGSTNTTAYGTSSDYRLKEDYKDFNGLDIVSNIPVYDFQWKKSGTRAYGVQAHELQEALPQAVNGEKDGENYQSVDYSKIVPVLLKSIQELKAEIETLKAQINN